MRLAHALLPLLLQAGWAAAQDLPANDRAVAFQGEQTCRPPTASPAAGDAGRGPDARCSPGPFP